MRIISVYLLKEILFMENQLTRPEKVRFDEKTPILASKKDKEIFFDALMNPPGPNKNYAMRQNVINYSCKRINER